MKYKDILQEYNYQEDQDYPCPYFGICGGCTFQDLDYQQQLELKSRYLNELFKDIYPERISIEATDPWKYRNKMDFIYAFHKLGLRKRGDFKGVVDLQSCLLIQQRSLEVFGQVRGLLKEHQINSFSFLSHKGYLRYVVFRQMGNSGQLMLNFVINGTDIEPLMPVIEKLQPNVDCIVVSENSGKADLSFGDVLRSYNNDRIEEHLGDLKFEIQPNSFFQSNSAVTGQLYTALKEHIVPDDRVLDLYSGVGSITLFIADKAATVLGVENNQSAVSSAEANKELNKINNVEFIQEDVLKYLKNEQPDANCWIIDPPRAGIHPKVLKLIAERGPQKLIYVSCNPDQLHKDLEQLKEVYNINYFKGFDMFPQTYHLESLMTLERK